MAKDITNTIIEVKNDNVAIYVQSISADEMIKKIKRFIL
jgi:hypothetical protein